MSQSSNRCEFGFQEWTGSLATFPDWGGNAAHNTHAIGVWQDEPATYARIVALTGNPGFEPPDQVVNNWALAVDVYGDLLAALHANGLPLPRFPSHPDSVGVKLIKRLAERANRVG